MLNYIFPLLRNPTDSRLLFLLHKGAGRCCPVEERACWDRPGKEDEDVDDHDDEEEDQTIQGLTKKMRIWMIMMLMRRRRRTRLNRT